MPPDCAQALENADGIVIRSGTQLTAEILEGQSRLKAIVRAGVGVDNIDVSAATRRGIVVMNTPGGNTISTAEHTMALHAVAGAKCSQGQRKPQVGQVGTQQVHRHASSQAKPWVSSAWGASDWPSPSELVGLE